MSLDAKNQDVTLPPAGSVSRNLLMQPAGERDCGIACSAPLVRHPTMTGDTGAVHGFL
jgi:hypothetical protein